MEAKTQFMLDNFKRAYPQRFARHEREWLAKEGEAFKADFDIATPKIDWTKPLKCNNSAVTNIEYIRPLWIQELGDVHLVRLTYRQGYTYYTMYTHEGRTVGNNAGTINVKNVPEQVTRWYAISKKTGDAVATSAESEWDSWNLARGKGYAHADLTFTSHTFTR